MRQKLKFAESAWGAAPSTPPLEPSFVSSWFVQLGKRANKPCVDLWVTVVCGRPEASMPPKTPHEAVAFADKVQVDGWWCVVKT